MGLHVDNSGGSRNLRYGAIPSPVSSLSFSLPSLYLPFHPLPFSLPFSFPFELGSPLNQLEGPGEHCKLPQWGENDFDAL